MRYTSQLRTLMETEKRTKTQLQAVLSPCLGGNTRDPQAPEQAAAKAACGEALRILKGCKPDTLHCSGAGRYQLAYLNEISELWLALHWQSWTGACSALYDLVHFNLITQQLHSKQMEKWNWMFIPWNACFPLSQQTASSGI